MLPRVNGGPGADGAARQLTKSEEERRGNGGLAGNTHARTYARARARIIAWHNIKRRLTAITQVSHAPPRAWPSSPPPLPLPPPSSQDRLLIRASSSQCSH